PPGQLDAAATGPALASSIRTPQSGMQEGVIDPLRATVIRGQVCEQNGNAIVDARITVLNHSEYGSTFTGADGVFDLLVNGGDLMTLVYTKTGYLPSQRQTLTPAQDYVWLPDIVMLAVDTQVTVIDLSTPAMQVARGSAITDVDGARQATLLIPRYTQAELVLSNGTTQTLTNLHIRATEYTVGRAGPLAMPAPLPPSSGYTYALEYGADEALLAGADEVRFSQALFHYVENFLNFPVGTAVPMGYYDRAKALWIPSDNGRVIKILSIISGTANLDTDGNGVADNGVVITPSKVLTITADERQQLAGLYQAGQSLWRVPITHFTPWDCNWPYGPPPGAKPPDKKPLPNPPLDCPQCKGGSIIETQNQVLGEEVALDNAPFSLNYRSDRAPGRVAAYTLDIPLSGSSVPTGLARIALEVSIAGQRDTRQFSAAPNQNTQFIWNGKDAYGQILQGQQRITTRIGYVYTATYQQPAQLAQGFAALSGVPFTANPARQEVTLWQDWSGMLGTLDARSQGLGGWSLDANHVYDPKSKTLYLGDGTRRSTESLGAAIINTFAGGGNVPGPGIGDGGPATQAELAVPNSVAVGPDGSVYIAETYHYGVRRVDAAGMITTVAGSGVFGFSGDGGPAISATLNNPYGIAVAPDASLFISDLGNNRIRRVDANGVITTVAGTGPYGFSGDGGPATLAQLNGPYGVGLGPDGSLYIADRDNSRVRRVGPDGIISTVAGGGACGGSQGDGGPATWACLSQPWRITVGPDGSLYIADRGHHRVRRVGTDGFISTVAGAGTGGFSGDGGPATLAQLSSPEDIAVGADGTLYIADASNYRVRQVGSDGIINTVAGNGTSGFNVGADGGLAIRAQFSKPTGLALGQDGRLYVADYLNQRVRRVMTILPGGSAGNIIIPSRDASQVYVFSGSGRHLRTLHALTGAILHEFSYDGAFRLTAVTDGDGNVTTIARDISGKPTAIVGPYGQTTMLALDANGYLSGITNPANETIQLASTPGGLLTSFTSARGHTSSFTYDSLGRLTRDDDPAGGFKTLSRADESLAYTVTYGTALNNTTAYQVANQNNGDQRRLNTLANGTLFESTRRADGAETSRSPEGVVNAAVLGPDPSWGMQAPLAIAAAITTPAGLRASIAVTRTTSLTDTANPLSLVSLIETSVLNGRAFTTTFTAANRTFTETTPEKRVTVATIDSQGRPTKEQVGGLLPTLYTYDSRGRLGTVSQGAGSESRVITRTYDSNGYLAAITDPLGRVTSLARDPAGRVTTETLPDGRAIRYAYDASGNLTSLAPPGRPAHTFAHTAVELASSYSPPAASAATTPTLYAYNADRQLIRITRPDGQAVMIGYDGAGRQVSMTLGRGVINTTFDPATGNTATINTPGGTQLAFTYDGSLPTGEIWSGPVSGAVSRNYDNNFRVISITVNGQAIGFRYDGDNLLTRAGDLTLTRSLQNDLILGTSLGGITDTRGPNGFGEVISYTASFSATPLYAALYDRDKLGRIRQVTETIGVASTVVSYTYDLAGRLATVSTNGAPTAAYSYDSNGNRLSVTRPGGVTNGTYDAQDRLLQYGEAGFTYAPSGELRTKTNGAGTKTYEYDEAGNLITVTQPISIGPQLIYVVDGQNRRIGKRVNGALIQGFLYEDDLRPVAELDGGNNIVSRFVYPGDGNIPYYMIKGGMTYRILTNDQGSPVLVVSTSTGQAIQRIAYDEFGRVLSDTNPGFQPFGFAGGLYDRDTQLTRFGARDYDAEAGRWTAKDPILFDGGDA
ncbi:MAG: RHS repeat-associated core domain-containing protein, partial [Thermoflexales bacterium]